MLVGEKFFTTTVKKNIMLDISPHKINLEIIKSP